MRKIDRVKALASQSLWQEALDAAELVPPGDGDYLEAKKLIALIYAHTQQNEHACNAFSGLLDEKPQDKDSWLLALQFLRDRKSDALLLHQLNNLPASLRADMSIIDTLIPALVRNNQWQGVIDLLAPLTAQQTNNANLWLIYALALLQQGEFQPAEAAYRHALTLAPDNLDAKLNLANCLARQDRFAEAIDIYKPVLEQHPERNDTLFNLANCYHSLAAFDEARALYEKLIARNPNDALAHYSLAMQLFHLGDYEQAWEAFQWRWQTPEFIGQIPPWKIPEWQGEDITGKHLLVWNEQGIGDEIMFARFIPELAKVTSQITLVCTPRLFPLYRRSFPDSTIKRSDELDHAQFRGADYQLPIGNLPLLVKKQLPPAQQFIHCDEHRSMTLKNQYRRAATDLLIGISWQSKAPMSGFRRSMDLLSWLPILQQPGVRWVNLQYGNCDTEIANLKEHSGIEIIQDASIDAMIDLDGFAAQTAAMDLVITIGNSTAHFSGAQNVPTWVLLPFVPSWRYQYQGKESLWYDSVTFFRQPEPNHWTEVIDEVATELTTFIHNRSSTA